MNHQTILSPDTQAVAAGLQRFDFDDISFSPGQALFTNEVRAVAVAERKRTKEQEEWKQQKEKEKGETMSSRPPNAFQSAHDHKVFEENHHRALALVASQKKAPSSDNHPETPSKESANREVEGLKRPDLESPAYPKRKPTPTQTFSPNPFTVTKVFSKKSSPKPKKPKKSPSTSKKHAEDLGDVRRREWAIKEVKAVFPEEGDPLRTGAIQILEKGRLDPEIGRAVQKKQAANPDSTDKGGRVPGKKSTAAKKQPPKKNPMPQKPTLRRQTQSGGKSAKKRRSQKNVSSLAPDKT